VLIDNTHLSNAGDCAICGDGTAADLYVQGQQHRACPVNTATVDTNAFEMLQKVLSLQATAQELYIAGMSSKW
jgi:hypothetical protein